MYLEKEHPVRVHSTPPAGAAMAGRPTYTGYVAKKMMVLIAEWLGIKKDAGALESPPADKGL